MIACPRCKSEDLDVRKTWDVVPKTGKGKAMRVTLYSCKTCGNKYRKASKLEVQASPVPVPFPLTKKGGVLKVMVSKDMDSTSLKGDGGSEVTPRLYSYIKSHDGILDIDRSASELETSVDEIMKAVEILVKEGRIRIEGPSTLDEPTKPPVSTPVSPVATQSSSTSTASQAKKDSFFGRVRRGFLGLF